MTSTMAKSLSLLFALCCAFGSAAWAQVPRDMTKEYEALDQARGALAEVSDEKAAKAAAELIKKIFDDIPAVYQYHSDASLTKLHDKQNIINRMMVRLSKEEYFKSSGLQESWAYILDPERREATLRNKGRRRR